MFVICRVPRVDLYVELCVESASSFGEDLVSDLVKGHLELGRSVLLNVQRNTYQGSRETTLKVDMLWKIEFLRWF